MFFAYASDPVPKQISLFRTYLKVLMEVDMNMVTAKLDIDTLVAYQW